MKNTIFALILTLIVSVQVSAQWFWQNPYPQGNNLSDVDFVSPEVGWAVGDIGTIIKTTNGGIDWVWQSSGTTRYLSSVSFTDQNNGTAVGSGGTIIRTTDGGATWNTQISGTIADLYDVSFADVNNGLAVGCNNILAKPLRI